MAPVMERAARMFAVDPSGCWTWTGSLNADGYGLLRDGSGTLRVAHRVVYEATVGPIPEGLELDHLCRVRSCVNPLHLEPVTKAVNLARARAVRPRSVTCGCGAAWRVSPTGKRWCSPCTVARNRRNRAVLAVTLS